MKTRHLQLQNAAIQCFNWYPNREMLKSTGPSHWILPQPKHEAWTPATTESHLHTWLILSLTSASRNQKKHQGGNLPKFIQNVQLANQLHVANQHVSRVSTTPGDTETQLAVNGAGCRSSPGVRLSGFVARLAWRILLLRLSPKWREKPICEPATRFLGEMVLQVSHWNTPPAGKLSCVVS